MEAPPFAADAPAPAATPASAAAPAAAGGPPASPPAAGPSSGSGEETEAAELADADDSLRGLPPSDFAEIEFETGGIAPSLPTAPVTLKITPAGEPQDVGVRYSATDVATGRTIPVGKVAVYPKSTARYRGIARYAAPAYDRFAAERQLGLWAHFIWPSVMAEGDGLHVVINTWDRAHFTWGFYQLAAHTAGDNLILLMRELVKLPTARFYFPDLSLLPTGQLARDTGAGPKSLEREVFDQKRKEWQLPDFMAYMNPTAGRVEEAEVVNAAKFIHWAQSDPDMLATTIRVSFSIMKRKIRAFSAEYGLVGRRPETALWVSDMKHQGRAVDSKIRAALKITDFEAQLEALYNIDKANDQKPRRDTVKRYVTLLRGEKRFDGVKFGEGPLTLGEPVVA